MTKENNAEKFQREQVEALELEFESFLFESESENLKEFTLHKLAQIIVYQANIDNKLATMNQKVNRLR